MTTHTASCRCDQLRASATGDRVRLTVSEERKHEWVEISGEGVEHIR